MCDHIIVIKRNGQQVPYATIAAALEAADPGDEIHVPPGTYEQDCQEVIDEQA